MGKIKILNNIIRTALKQNNECSWVCDDECVDYVNKKYKKISGIEMNELQLEFLRINMTPGAFSDIQKEFKLILNK